jgi:hypothetical protein
MVPIPHLGEAEYNSDLLGILAVMFQVARTLGVLDTAEPPFSYQTNSFVIHKWKIGE